MKNDQLLVPEAVKADPNSMEIIRVWVANKNQHFSLRSGVWNDPAAWGMLLADLAKSIAKSYEEDERKDFRIILERIRLGFNVEIETPTSS